jgi:hypothetical protein
MLAGLALFMPATAAEAIGEDVSPLIVAPEPGDVWGDIHIYPQGCLGDVCSVKVGAEGRLTGWARSDLKLSFTFYRDGRSIGSWGAFTCYSSTYCGPRSSGVGTGGGTFWAFVQNPLYCVVVRGTASYPGGNVTDSFQSCQRVNSA